MKARDLFDVFYIIKTYGFNEFEEFINEKMVLNRMHNWKLLFINNIDKYRPIWEKELKYFVLYELPEFDWVSEYLKNVFT